MSGHSAYVSRLGQQPGVQLTPVAQAVSALELTDIADRVVAVVARTRRGRIDRPVAVDRSTATSVLGEVESNLVRSVHEARMQVADALDAGASAVLVSRLVPAAAKVRYIGVGLGASAAPVAVASISAPTTVSEGASLVATVAMTGGTGLAGIPFAVSGVTALDVGGISFGSGVTLSGGLLTVPAGVSSFVVTIPVIADLTTEGAELLTIAVGGRSATTTVIDSSLSAPPPSYVYAVEASGGWMHPTNAYNVPYIRPLEGKIMMHPGPGFERPIVSFTNTFGAGVFRVVVSTPPDDQADANYLQVVRGGAIIADVSWPSGGFDSELTLAAGEKLEFPLMGGSYAGGGRFIVVDVWKLTASGAIKVANAYDDFAASSGSPTATWAYFYRSDVGHPNGVINSAGPMRPIGGAVPESSVISVSASSAVDEGDSVVATVVMSNNYGASSVPFSIAGISGGDYAAPAFSNGVSMDGGIVSIPYGVETFTITIPILIDTASDDAETMVVSVGGAFDSVLINDVAMTGTDGAAILAMLPALWIDPSNESLMTKTGLVVDAIQDKSGYGRHCTKIGSPVFTSSHLAGAIRLGSGGFDIGGPVLPMREFTLYAVVYIDAIGSTARSIAFISNGDLAVGCNAAMIFTSGAQDQAGVQVSSSSAYSYTGGVPSISVGVPHLVTIKQKMTWAESEFTLDGSIVLPVISLTGSTPMANFTYIGKQPTYQTNGWELGEVVVIPRVTTEGEDAVVESYLKAKWGVS